MKIFVGIIFAAVMCGLAGDCAAAPASGDIAAYEKRGTGVDASTPVADRQAAGEILDGLPASTDALHKSFVAEVSTTDVVSWLVNYSEPEKQEKAIRAVISAPEAYKSVLLGYLSQKRRLTSAATGPSEAVLYAIGFARDRDYFPYLFKLLQTDYAKDQCIYSCGLVFAAILTCPDIKFINEKRDSAPMYDFSVGLKKYLSAKQMNHALRKETAMSYLPKYANGTIPKEFLDYPVAKLVGILRNRSLDYRIQLNASIALSYLGISMDTAADLLVLAVLGPRDESNEISGSCEEGVLNILIQNKKNTLAGK